MKLAQANKKRKNAWQANFSEIRPQGFKPLIIKLHCLLNVFYFITQPFSIEKGSYCKWVTLQYILNKIINAPCGTLKLLLALRVAKYIKSYKINFVVQYATDYCPLEHNNYKTISAHLGSPISCYINNLHGAFIFLLSVDLWWMLTVCAPVLFYLLDFYLFYTSNTASANNRMDRSMS